MNEFIIQNKPFCLAILIAIIVVIAIAITRYNINIKRELKSLKKSINNHGCFIAYFLEDYEKKKNSKYKYPTDFDKELFGILGYMPTKNREIIENMTKNEK